MTGIICTLIVSIKPTGTSYPVCEYRIPGREATEIALCRTQNRCNYKKEIEIDNVKIEESVKSGAETIQLTQGL